MVSVQLKKEKKIVMEKTVRENVRCDVLTEGEFEMMIANRVKADRIPPDELKGLREKLEITFPVFRKFISPMGFHVIHCVRSSSEMMFVRHDAEWRNPTVQAKLRPEWKGSKDYLMGTGQYACTREEYMNALAKAHDCMVAAQLKSEGRGSTALTMTDKAN